nr:max-like protein X isoform X2 [Cavia porcellus]
MRMRDILDPPPSGARGLAELGHVGAPCGLPVRRGQSAMTEPGASPEDPWVKVECTLSDTSLDPGLFVESVRKGSVVSRANSIGSTSASSVPNTAIDYIQFLHKEKKKQEEEVSTLRKDVTALKIMKVNYEQIVKAHRNNPHEGKDQVSDQVKFNVFQGIMDSLFQSFNASISVASFQELSACVFSWIEEHCKPQTLRDTVLGVLHQLKNQLY